MGKYKNTTNQVICVIIYKLLQGIHQGKFSLLSEDDCSTDLDLNIAQCCSYF